MDVSLIASLFWCVLSMVAGYFAGASVERKHQVKFWQSELERVSRNYEA